MDVICDLACTVGAGECGCERRGLGCGRDGKLEAGSGRREVFPRQGLIEGTADHILIRTNLDKLASAANT